MKFRAAHLYRREPAGDGLADSLPRGANAAETRYNSDIVVEVRTNAEFSPCRNA